MDRNTQRRDFKRLGLLVALRKESVDRNTYYIGRFSKCCFVALRKESVDRNMGFVRGCFFLRVALRKESVDRNILLIPLITLLISRSPQGERG